MGKKLTIEHIRGKYEERGYTLTSTEYINSKTKLNYICPNGHEGSMTWGNFKSGYGCPNCYGNTTYTIEYIRGQFASKRCVLKSTEYINNKMKLDYICPNGHKHSIRWNDFQQGNGCVYCAGIFNKDIQYIRKQFETRKWYLKSTEYVNNKVPLDYICDKGHAGSITWNNFISGVGCSECAVINNSGSKHYNWMGGISCDPYCDAWADKEYKESIKERDGYRCQNPYCSCNGGIGDLCIHHIDFNKKNCSPSNLITVCRSCNSFANKDRDWHIAWYQTLMNHKHGYIYV